MTTFVKIHQDLDHTYCDLLYLKSEDMSVSGMYETE